MLHTFFHTMVAVVRLVILQQELGTMVPETLCKGTFATSPASNSLAVAHCCIFAADYVCSETVHSVHAMYGAGPTFQQQPLSHLCEHKTHQKHWSFSKQPAILETQTPTQLL